LGKKIGNTIGVRSKHNEGTSMTGRVEQEKKGARWENKASTTVVKRDLRGYERILNSVQKSDKTIRNCKMANKIE